VEFLLSVSDPIAGRLGRRRPHPGPRAAIPVCASFVPASPGALGGTAAAAAPRSSEDCLVL